VFDARARVIGVKTVLWYLVLARGSSRNRSAGAAVRRSQSMPSTTTTATTAPARHSPDIQGSVEALSARPE